MLTRYDVDLDGYEYECENGFYCCYDDVAALVDSIYDWMLDNGYIMNG